MGAPDLSPVLEALAREGWRGFVLLRRHLARNPRERRAVARRLEDVPWERRSDLEARRVRFAFLSDALTANFREPLLLECLERGVIPVAYHAPPGPLAREVGDPASGLWSCGADVIVVGQAAPDPVPPGFLDRLLLDLDTVRGRSAATLLVHGFLAEEGATAERREACARLGRDLAEGCRGIAGTRVVDLGAAAAASGARFWTLHKTRFLGGYAFPEEMAAELCRGYAAAGAAARGLVRKCLVLDLDDTLWGGIVGEVGVAALELGEGHPGSVYREVQRQARRLRERGVVLAINSANDEEDVWPALARPESLLGRHDFAAWRVNWEDKADNLRSLAEELGLSLDSLVVLDDDPVNREWIEERLPEVHVLPAQDPLDMARALATTLLFEGLHLTAEDRGRAAAYAAARLRRESEGASSDREAFLAGLGLRVTVGPAPPEHLPRLAQLSQRTNQFNLTARRYTQAELAGLCADPDHAVLFCACRDRFGDEGVTGLAVLRRREAEWSVDAFALSCRVLRWGVERTLAAVACRAAAERGGTSLLGEYVPTTRNRQAEWFYRDLGFAPVSVTAAGSTWRLALPAPADMPAPWITLEGA
jgi:FkbH-like protein